MPAVDALTRIADRPDAPGSLGIAISETVEDAATHGDPHSSLGPVLDHVLLHQTVIVQEALKQIDLAGEHPDVVIGRGGGGSNFSGLAFLFVGEKLRQGYKTRIVATPLLSQLVDEALVEAVAYQQNSMFEAAVLLARTEGIVPAPESLQAIQAALTELPKLAAPV
jgi:tryptophan synthase beta chain